MLWSTNWKIVLKLRFECLDVRHGNLVRPNARTISGIGLLCRRASLIENRDLPYYRSNCDERGYK